MIDFRSRHKDPRQFCDVLYTDLLKDPVASVRAVYAHFGLTVSAEHEQRMRQYMLDNPQGKHGRAAYEASDYGLDKATLTKRYSRYVQTYLS